MTRRNLLSFLIAAPVAAKAIMKPAVFDAADIIVPPPSGAVIDKLIPIDPYASGAVIDKLIPIDPYAKARVISFDKDELVVEFTHSGFGYTTRKVYKTASVDFAANADLVEVTDCADAWRVYVTAKVYMTVWLQSEVRSGGEFRTYPLSFNTAASEEIEIKASFDWFTGASDGSVVKVSYNSPTV